jgi:hypothetical protein
MEQTDVYDPKFHVVLETFLAGTLDSWQKDHGPKGATSTTRRLDEFCKESAELDVLCHVCPENHLEGVGSVPFEQSVGMKLLDRCPVVCIELADAVEAFEIQLVKDHLRDLKRHHIQSSASQSLNVRFG